MTLNKLTGRSLGRSANYTEGERSKSVEVCETTHPDGNKTYTIKVRCEVAGLGGSSNNLSGLTLKDLRTIKFLLRNI